MYDYWDLRTTCRKNSSRFLFSSSAIPSPSPSLDPHNLCNQIQMTQTKTSPKLHHETTVIKSAIISRLIVLTLILLWRTLLSPYDTSAPINPNCLSNNTSQPNVDLQQQQQQQQHVLLPSLGSAIESSIVWDSVYFVRIAQCGYEYEQTYAFLPLLPLCISLLSRTGLVQLYQFFSDTFLVNLLVFFIFKQYPVGNLSTLCIPTWWFCISLLMIEWVFLFFEGVLCVSVLAPLVPVIGQRAVLGLSGFVINNIAFVIVAVYLYRWFGWIFLNSIWLSKSLLGLKLFGSFKYVFFPYNN